MFTRTSKWLLLLAVLSLAAFVAAGCEGGGGGGGGDGESGDLAAEQHLVINIKGEPDSLDPSLTADIDSANVLAQIQRGLTYIEGDENEVVPMLAESWDISEDGLVYTFHLREGIEWSDGQPITAQDFVYGWTRSLDPKTGSQYSYQMLGIKGSREADGESFNPANLGVKAVDDQTLEVTLSEAAPWFLEQVALSVFYPQREDLVKQHGNKLTEAANNVYSGPFVMTEWQHGQQIMLEKNESFWDADNVTLETVEMKMIGEPATALTEFEAGELDTAFGGGLIPDADLERYKEDDRYLAIPVLATQYVWMNTKNPELADPNVRKAISMAINRQSMVDNVTRSGEVPMGTLIPEGLTGYDEISEVSTIDPTAEPDLEAAQTLLEEGGWQEGTELNIYFTAEGSATGPRVAAAIQSDLEKIGITVKLVQLPSFDALLDAANPPLDPKVDLLMLGWIADFTDGYNFYSLLECQSDFNVSQWCNEEYDEVVESVKGMTETADRIEVYKEAESMLTGEEGEMPLVPLYRDTERTLVQPWVVGFNVTGMGFINLADVEIREH